MAHDVFISYSHRDKATADAICHALEDRGIRCWIAPRDVVAGRSWKRSIVQAIQDARVMVLVFSGEANGSMQVQREVDIAFEAGHPIVPLRIEDVEMSEDLYYCIGSRHWLDGLTPPLERHIEKLADAVAQLVEPTSRAAVPEAESAGAVPIRSASTADRKTVPFARRPAATATAPTTRARHRRSLRGRRLIPVVLAGVIVAGLGGWLAAERGIWGPPWVLVDVSSEAVTLVPEGDLDLVARTQWAMSPGAREAVGIRLDPQLIYIRGVAVRVSGSEGAVFETQGDGALAAAVVQRLSVTSGCTLHFDRLADGSVRLGIFPRLTEADPQRSCEVEGQVWSGAPPPLDNPDDVLSDWVPVPPRQIVTLAATPTLGQPVSLNFRPAEPVRLHRIGVEGIMFETRDRGPYVESAILGGTIRFPRAGDEIEQVRLRDTLLLNRLNGEILELTLGDSIRTLYEGTSSRPSISTRSLAPGVLQQLYHSAPFRVVIGALTLAAVFFAVRFAA